MFLEILCKAQISNRWLILGFENMPFSQINDETQILPCKTVLDTACKGDRVTVIFLQF